MHFEKRSEFWLIDPEFRSEEGEGEGVDNFVIIFDDETAIIPTKTVTFFTEQQWVPPLYTHLKTRELGKDVFSIQPG